MRQVIDEFVLVQRGEAAERINGTMILSETAAFIYEHLEEAIKVRMSRTIRLGMKRNQNYWLDLRFHALFPCW